ncbi:MAG: hypothetical protein A4S16_09680 [Proteobacteria bacterium SG_bin6]|nr:MAG: hypothetical protein A4S16_09680 [Proteobacteria bacterium SG_bin6]
MHRLVLLAALFAIPHAALAADPPACQPSVEGRLELIDFDSESFPGARKLRVWLPQGYDPAKRYPVLYMLDGQNLFDRCTGYGNQEWTADEVASQAIARGDIPPLYIVGIDNGGARRAREYLPYPDPFNADAASVEGQKLAAMLRDEVLPLIGKRYAVREDRDGRALGGSSYGGVATLQVILTHPDLFGGALIESPSLQVGNGQLLRDTEHVVALPDRVFIGMGGAELQTSPHAGATERAQAARFNAGAVAGARTLAANLSASLLPSATKLVVAPNAHHNEAAWAARLPEALRFLFGAPPQARR